MTPGQAQGALLAFLLLTAGVAINALFLQAPPATAPTSGKASPQAFSPPLSYAASERLVRSARFKPDSARIGTMPAAPETQLASDVVRAVQRELRQRGYGALATNGILTLSTRLAILSYEHDQGLPPSGEASEALLKRILLGPSAGTPANEPNRGKLWAAHHEAVVGVVQQSLLALGYQPGRSDGRPSEETERAIREFEMDRGLVPSGRVSGELLTHLAAALGPSETRTAR
jgi:peptidoglycan hydrolase-like protein with peptidoglycan-binding domain